MNKQILTSILFTSFVFFCCKSSYDCSNFKNGKFKFHSHIANKNIVIERKDSLQNEIELESGDTTLERVIWKSPCQYDLLEISTTKLIPNKADTFLKVNPIHANIIGISKNYYITLSTLNAGSRKYTLTDTIYSFGKNIP
jgi:hypothetical protein